MSKCRLYLLPLSLVLTSVLGMNSRASDAPADSFGGRLATYDKAAGESYFALSVTSQARPKPADVCDVVVLVDTSASQTGLFREDTLLAVRTLIDRLEEQDRVKLFAVDLEAVPLCDQFFPASGPEIQECLRKLAQRTPLGSTDMVAALLAAVNSWEGPAAGPRAVVYVGDGFSRANFFGDLEIRDLVRTFSERRASLSSMAIGPDRSIELLAIMANQTGGVLWIDTNDETSAEHAGIELAKAARQTVFWPQQVQFSQGIAEFYPTNVPPLRTDRDTIVVGRLENHDAQDLTLQAEANGELVEMRWRLTAERSSDDFAFLPTLVDMARNNGGLTLPTVGSAGLREVARVILTSSEDLSFFGPRPQSEDAAPGQSVWRFCSYQDEPAEDDAPETEPAAEPPAGDDELLSDLRPQARLLDIVKANRQVLAERIQAEVRQGLDMARRQMGTDAQAAVQGLKVILDNVERAPELDPAIRAQLRDRIVAAMREAGRRQVELDEVRRQAQENRAIADEAQRLAAEFTDQRQRVRQLMEKFDALVEEGISLAMQGESEMAKANFEAAINEIADPIESLLPLDTIGTSARYNANFLRQLTGIRKFRELKHRGFVNALYEVERASIPFSDDPPIVFPDPEFWERISISREKYKSMDLLSSGTPERRIYDALQEEIFLEFSEAPLSEVIDFIKNSLDIPIILDRRALDDVGINSDSPVTISLAGVRLRSGLRIMLRELELTYVIRDEVLKITTPEEAENELLTKVYPVADLVMPIISGMGGGMMGGMGGGMGGGMMGGGMGGGMGGMGGGMGGMGMGGMGGMFAVEDDLTLGAKADPAPTPDTASSHAAPALDDALPWRGLVVQPSEPIVVEVAPDQSSADAWDAYFAQHADRRAEDALKLDGQIRATAQQLSEQGKYAEIVALLESAIRNSLVQPWMYEALGLAMMAADAPPLEVERAFMSAVDLTNSHDEAMGVAMYLARLGFDRRALRLMQEIAYANPSRPEPYAAGLACARRLDDADAIRWATLGILSQAWPDDQSGIEDRALRLAKATVERLRADGQVDEAAAYETAIEQAGTRDVIVKVTWTGDADVDVMVEEPGGTICSLHNPRTIAGGVMLGDAFAGGAQAAGYTETYVCPEGFSGQYRVLVQRVWGDVTAGKVTVDIHTRNAAQPHIHQQIPLGEKDALVMFDVEKGRRSDHLAQQHIAQLRKPPTAENRAALSRQLGRYEDSLAQRDYRRARAQQRGWNGGGPVGFQPQIQTLPEGASLSGAGALAVISADRRYVRAAPVPFFSVIGEVNTFNFGALPSNDLPDDDDDDDDDDGGGDAGN